VSPTITRQSWRRIRFVALAGLTTALSVTGTPASESLLVPSERASYSLGHQIGVDLVRQGSKVDLDSLRRGLRDALAGREPALPDEVRNALLVGLKRGIVATERDERIRGTSSLRKAGASFLADNRAKPGVVQLESGLQYRVIREGTGPRPSASDLVRVRYRSTRLDGTAFHDSMSDGHDSETFRVSTLIAGLGEALQLMPEASRWEIFVPPDLAFGRRGPLQDQTVVYDLELIEVFTAEANGPEGAS
jgi:FKBP-type peptidyl-prolyl cis-trans isomerase